ncbi:cobalamin adenosyltransferase [Proteus alimentorum]|uniref:Cobalamin adenosyltransferase n=1 Tax=Proteus alimentorum TaxID=1973495 RepID=A0ABS0IR61_9GAMM|nr:cobalamin adenosyltransferase [Proteus alimentorum]MBG2876694.1 cobalamin adenosyltransferase [Proteus alimentorum]MBG2878482.1 cobalamin adenosyltransferase [Proteus alimentorum]
MERTNYNWQQEINNTIVQSLATSFGLDFLLLKDKVGGDVDTTHNVRENIWATDTEKSNYENREKYDKDSYHKHQNYININKNGKQRKLNGELKDSYTGETFSQNDKINLDHIIAAHEIHNDPARLLAELNGEDLANRESNLTFTNETLNKSKKADSMSDFIKRLQSQQVEIKSEINILESKTQLSDNERKRLASLKNKEKANFEEMVAIDIKARKKYDAEIDNKYYTSSKFFSNTASSAINIGFRMGTRQMLGIIFAELWFELKDSIPKLISNHKSNFKFDSFLNEVGDIITNIWERLKIKFKDFFTEFKNGFFGGLLASVTTTLLNIFLTSTKLVGKLIRESWNSLISALKLMFFNPENLSLGDLLKSTTKIISTSISVILGSILTSWLNGILTFPFGNDMALFIGALASGLLTLAMCYFLEYSSLMQKVWSFLNKFRNKYELTLQYYQNVNQELDKYLEDLTKLEFNFDIIEMQKFVTSLQATNSEFERKLILNNEIKRNNIELPFDTNDDNSFSDWLNSL